MIQETDEKREATYMLLVLGKVSIEAVVGGDIFADVDGFEVIGSNTYHPDGEFTSWNCTCGECDCNPSPNLKPEFRTDKMCAHALAVALVWEKG